MLHFSKFIFITFILTLANPCLHAQVNTIKESVRNDTRTSFSYSSRTTSPSSYSDRTSFSESLTANIITGIIQGVGFITIETQKSVLRNKERYPNLISLETGLDYGSNLADITFTPSVRANWGLFASDFRYALLYDNTGSLQSLDWQVLIVRIPIKNIKLNYGIGFTSLLDPQTTYFESSTGFDLNLFESKLNFSANYRWTARKADKRYRQEVKLTGEYAIIQRTHFSTSPMIGLSYQDYFNRDSYVLFNIGVKIRLSRGR